VRFRNQATVRTSGCRHVAVRPQPFSSGAAGMHPYLIRPAIQAARQFQKLTWAGVLTLLLAVPVIAGENYALLVAVGDYDVKELRPLKYTRADVLEFHQALLDSGFPAKNVVLMHDDLKRLVAHYEKLGGGRDPK